jgi:isopentenyl-diphosphate delta-isomerase
MTRDPWLTGRDDDLVVLVDAHDAEIGVAPKLQAHRDGRLHRAVSVVLFDDTVRVLLQRRASGKYHSGGLWSNTCCGHPRPGESVIDTARRRLRDELGIEGVELMRVSEFVYFARLGGGLVEHELDHVAIGHWAGPVMPDSSEVSETRWIEPRALFVELAARRDAYTAWTDRVVRHACQYSDALGASLGGSRVDAHRAAG